METHTHRVSLWGLPALFLVLHCSGTRPPHVSIGTHHPCPSTPNCVSSQSDDTLHAMEPLTYPGSHEKARQRLRRVIQAMPRTRIVVDSATYLYAEFTSQVWRFVDDVEFFLDTTARFIHFRSASRLGQSDMGVNRDRMEEVARRFHDLAITSGKGK